MELLQIFAWATFCISAVIFFFVLVDNTFILFSKCWCVIPALTTLNYACMHRHRFTLTHTYSLCLSSVQKKKKLSCWWLTCCVLGEQHLWRQRVGMRKNRSAHLACPVMKNPRPTATRVADPSGERGLQRYWLVFLKSCAVWFDGLIVKSLKYGPKHSRDDN